MAEPATDKQGNRPDTNRPRQDIGVVKPGQFGTPGGPEVGVVKPANPDVANLKAYEDAKKAALGERMETFKSPPMSEESTAPKNELAPKKPVQPNAIKQL